MVSHITYPPNSLLPRSTFCLLGKLWSRSVKLAYTLLNKLGTKNEQILKPGDRVRALTHNKCSVILTNSFSTEEYNNILQYLQQQDVFTCVFACCALLMCLCARYLNPQQLQEPFIVADLLNYGRKAEIKH